jgi:hypothetical protein
VAPPSIGYTTTSQDAHVFESLGPRIPGLIISPLVKPGSVCSELFDHTSVLQFIAERFTNGAAYSSNVSKRKAAGIQSLSVALNNSVPYPAPPSPTVAINSPATLGKSLTKAPSTEMGKSFELAALQMLEQKPAEVARKYPELIQWKETAVKSGGGEDLIRATSQLVIPNLAGEASVPEAKTTAQPSDRVIKDDAAGLIPATSQPAIPTSSEAVGVSGAANIKSKTIVQPSDRGAKGGGAQSKPAVSKPAVKIKTPIPPSDRVAKGGAAKKKKVQKGGKGKV